MKFSFSSIYTVSKIVMVLTACGSKLDTSGLSSTEPALSKPSIIPSTINVKLSRGAFVNTQGALKKLDVTSGKFTAFCPGSFVAFAYQ